MTRQEKKARLGKANMIRLLESMTSAEREHPSTPYIVRVLDNGAFDFSHAPSRLRIVNVGCESRVVVLMKNSIDTPPTSINVSEMPVFRSIK